ncbi:hypothetical protein [Staphylococcus equorum]|uniref:hypothetical protein n=1 Tax=Staphylococcus equorum TaxID=246432 RepID=UPI0008534FE1|nr:hypothetical protein [Staphylococcus equorum]OEL08283.1 hypothetical protein AST04_08845 [Staphylococcus equorum]
MKKESTKEELVYILRATLFGLLIVGVLMAVVYMFVYLDNKANASANEKHESSINDVVKSSDIKTRYIIVKDNYTNTTDRLISMFGINDKRNKISVKYKESNMTPKNLKIVGEKQTSDNLKENFITDRKQPYKVKVMNTGAKEDILYEYKGYKLDTDSEDFKSEIRAMHHLK